MQPAAGGGSQDASTRGRLGFFDNGFREPQGRKRMMQEDDWRSMFSPRLTLLLAQASASPSPLRRTRSMIVDASTLFLLGVPPPLAQEIQGKDHGARSP